MIRIYGFLHSIQLRAIDVPLRKGNKRKGRRTVRFTLKFTVLNNIDWPFDGTTQVMFGKWCCHTYMLTVTMLYLVGLDAHG